MNSLIATGLALGALALPTFAGTQTGAHLKHESPEGAATTVVFTSDSYALRTLGRAEAYRTLPIGGETVESNAANAPSAYALREKGRAEAHEIPVTLSGAIGDAEDWGGFCSVPVHGRDC
jgi:hypothetical protein